MTRFIDANVIVKAFTENDNHVQCREILREDFVTNTLCLIEAYDAISMIKSNKIYASDCIRSLFKNKGRVVQLDKNLLFESFKRIQKYNLDIFDLIHYVTALMNNSSEFVSYDKDFDDFEIKRIEP